MKSVEVWSNHPESASQLVEKWVLQPDGKAALVSSKDGEILYRSIGGVTPDKGEEYLNRLIHVIQTASFLTTKVS